MHSIKNFIILLLNIVISIVVFLLGVRLILKLFGAGSASEFVAWVYNSSAPLVAPFAGIFPSPTLARRFTLELSTLFAIIIYAFVRYLIVEFVDFTTKK